MNAFLAFISAAESGPKTSPNDTTAQQALNMQVRRQIGRWLQTVCKLIPICEPVVEPCRIRRPGSGSRAGQLCL
jgi:hypothetical protein